MRRLTLREVREQYGGILPPDAGLRPDDQEITVEAEAEGEATAAAAREAAGPNPPAAKAKGARAERFAALNAFVDVGIAAAKLTPAEALVWLVLFRDTKAAGTALTAQTYVASRTGLNVRTVRRAVASLAAKGMLTVVRRGRLGGGPSLYRVHPTARP